MINPLHTFKFPRISYSDPGSIFMFFICLLFKGVDLPCSSTDSIWFLSKEVNGGVGNLPMVYDKHFVKG